MNLKRLICSTGAFSQLRSSIFASWIASPWISSWVFKVLDAKKTCPRLHIINVYYSDCRTVNVDLRMSRFREQGAEVGVHVRWWKPHHHGGRFFLNDVHSQPWRYNEMQLLAIEEKSLKTEMSKVKARAEAMAEALYVGKTKDSVKLRQGPGLNDTGFWRAYRSLKYKNLFEYYISLTLDEAIARHGGGLYPIEML